MALAAAVARVEALGRPVAAAGREPSVAAWRIRRRCQTASAVAATVRAVVTPTCRVELVVAAVARFT
jgi:hypothetical protein